MSLNKYMHPRNRYKNAKPSFLQLALKYPDFRAMTTQDESGKVFLDFKNADALRALTRCLLKEDFDLTVELPMDRLVPTLPLRLNYIHWLEDIVGADETKWGIDIGTGASCVYPLLASKMNKWNFLATESDAENLYHAQKNVANNNLSHLINVKGASDESILTSSVQSFTGTDVFDFCMCNPPFFADHMEAQGLVTTRSDDRPEAGSVSTASPQECIVAGGEVAFVRQMIEESTVLREKIRVYTSMLGKKSSLAQLKEELRHQKVTKFSTTEFCQGKTMRWGLAWTFDSSVTFPRSQFEARKAKPPLFYVIPKGSSNVEYKVHELARYLRQHLESIKVHCYQGKQAKSYTSITLTAAENTWCHQRRFRRQQQKLTSESPVKCQQQASQVSREGKDEVSKASEDTNCVKDGGKFVKLCSNNEDNGVTERKISCPDKKLSDINTNLKRSLDDSLEVEHLKTKRQCTESCEETLSLKDTSTNTRSESDTTIGNANNNNCEAKKSDIVLPETKANITDVNISKKNNSAPSEDDSQRKESIDIESEVISSTSTEVLSQPKEYILKCVMRLKRSEENINLELEWLDGKSRELMHQVFTFLKNKLAQI
ncbi:methyltransferase-like protein [Elysia marginata]|uniref:U6 small nuclear RNA (adenine-(43)-N(6))-methyltransferase n=1 Tax=Elysia marginata TaxID=1093978 RepID=A0AAV4IS82_9GAST|nr:methyltransferase-like protein [Elysia marginata]